MGLRLFAREGDSPEGRVAGEHRVFIAPVASPMRASGPHLSPFTLLNMIQWSFGEDHLDCWVENSKTARLDAVTGSRWDSGGL